jgi:hypothetical protein
MIAPHSIWNTFIYLMFKQKKSTNRIGGVALSLYIVLILCMFSLSAAYGQPQRSLHVRNVAAESFSNISRQSANIFIEKNDITHNKVITTRFGPQEPNPQIRDVVAESFSNISRSFGNITNATNP